MAESRYSEPSPGTPKAAGSDFEAATTERYYRWIRLFAARRTGDWAAAEDVAQETLRRAFQSMRAGRIENPEALGGFLLQTAKHICFNYSRAAGREGRALGRYGALVPGMSSDDPLEFLISEERRAQVRRAVEQLDVGDREVISLSYDEALTTAEIGKRLQMTEGNVRVRRHRAVKRLATLLGVTKRTGRGLKD